MNCSTCTKLQLHTFTGIHIPIMHILANCHLVAYKVKYMSAYGYKFQNTVCYSFYIAVPKIAYLELAE